MKPARCWYEPTSEWTDKKGLSSVVAGIKGWSPLKGMDFPEIQEYFINAMFNHNHDGVTIRCVEEPEEEVRP